MCEHDCEEVHMVLRVVGVSVMIATSNKVKFGWSNSWLEATAVALDAQCFWILVISFLVVEPVRRLTTKGKYPAGINPFWQWVKRMRLWFIRVQHFRLLIVANKCKQLASY